MVGSLHVTYTVVPLNEVVEALGASGAEAARIGTVPESELYPIMFLA